MAYVADFVQVQQMLANARARRVSRTAAGDVYAATNGTFIRVVRNGNGFNIDVFRSRAECGCG